jgi:hypothetical protein
MNKNANNSLLTAAERVRKTALNTSLRFGITDSKGFDNSSLALYEEIKRRGLG